MPDAMLLALVVCLAAGAPSGVCNAEVHDLVFPVAPQWATASWQTYAAHIVASEARGVPSADIVIACTLIRDIERGYHPWNLHPGRWHGYGTPDDLDRKAVTDALLSSACVDVPRYKYVGNFRDAQYWVRSRTIDNGPFDLYVGPHGQAVVGVPYDD